MGSRIVTASVALLASCGPALHQGADHPASPDAPTAEAATLATALTGDPAPPPAPVSAAARSYALDRDVGVHPPVLDIAIPAGGAPLPSRDPDEPAQGVEPGDHAHEPQDHAHH